MKFKICSLLYALFLMTSVSFAQPGLRGLADTVGFAHTAKQMGVIMQRIGFEAKNDTALRLAISPHDDYTYVGPLYPEVLSRIKAKTVIIFGVAHKAKDFHLENQLIFDSFQSWRGPYGNIKISPLREEIIALLPKGTYQIHDSMQTAEHSVEALLPFIQYFNRDVQIISILVPYMSYEKMEELATPLSEALNKVIQKYGWILGKDYAIAISTDAVHYGDENWGGKNFAFLGNDKKGYEKAVSFEHQIIDECLTGEIKPEKVRKFTEYTVQKDNYKEYKWTWCGRYSVPFGLLTAHYLEKLSGASPLKGTLIGYSSSLDHEHIKVDDIGMGVTAPAKLRHWVGYAAIGFE